MALKVAAGALSGLAILAGKDGDFAIGPVSGVGESEADAGTGFAGRAAADGVDDDESGSRLGQCRVDFFGSPGLFNSSAHKLLAHGNHHQFWIHVRLRQEKLPAAILLGLRPRGFEGSS